MGQAFYLFLYNPISGETHELFQYMPASIGAFGASILFYSVAMALVEPGTRKKTSLPAAPGTRRLIRPNI